MLLRVLLAHVLHLEAAQRKALLLEALHDLGHQAALDAVGLDHDVRLLHRDGFEVRS